MGYDRTVKDLHDLQALPLEMKIALTKDRIREWVNEYGIDKVYVSFSGGIDSTALLHIAREIFPEIQGVYFDTGIEYPEVRKFVETYENVEIIKPVVTFRDAISTYGYPVISKEISGSLYIARRYLDQVKKLLEKQDLASPWHEWGGV